MDLIWGQRVASSDAWAGSLTGVLVALDTSLVTHLIVKRGLLFSTRFVVSMSSFDHYDAEGIYLNLPITEFLKLPKLRRGDTEPNLAAKTEDTAIHLADGCKLQLKGLRFTGENHLLTHFIVASPEKGNLLLPLETATDFNSRRIKVSTVKTALTGLPLHRLDSSIRADLSEALYLSDEIPQVDLREIQVKVVDGIIQFQGNVRTPLVITEAEKTARAVTGCVAVDNQLVSDWEIGLAIASYISRKLPRLSDSVIASTRFGKVTLEGNVSSDEDRDTIIQGVKSITGVKEIDDLTEVRVPVSVIAEQAASPGEDASAEEEPTG